MAAGQSHKIEAHAVALAAFGWPEGADAAPGRTVAFGNEPDDEGRRVGGWGRGFLGHGKSPCWVLEAAFIAAFRTARPNPPFSRRPHPTGRSAAENGQDAAFLRAQRPRGRIEEPGKKAAAAVAASGGGFRVCR
jgi:hypothetical protein